MTPKRIQMQRTKGWRKPENTIYVGRPTKWGNPFKVGETVDWKGERLLLASAAMTVSLYETLARSRHEPSLQDIILELNGRNLACWCRLDEPCHADVLLRLANAPE